MSSAQLQAENPYASFGATVADAPVDARVAFIRKTYLHLAAAIYGFVALEFLFFKTLPIDDLIPRFFNNVPYAGLLMLAAFIAVSWVANRWAHSDTSVGMQYAGLGLYVFFEAVIFVPLLWFAQSRTINVAGLGERGVIPVAAAVTLALFGVLTAAVFVTRKDFSFLRTGLMMAGFGAIVLILISALMGFSLGFWFIAAMIAFACGYILYDTSNVLHHYNTHQHVAASLALFASVALLFWYVIQLLMSLSRD